MQRFFHQVFDVGVREMRVRFKAVTISVLEGPFCTLNGFAFRHLGKVLGRREANLRSKEMDNPEAASRILSNGY